MSWLYKLRLKRINRLLNKLGSSVEKTPQENIQTKSVSFDEITKISEDLNEVQWNFPLYIDTTKLFPGYVLYVVSKQEPTKETPYVTYKPEPRVVVSIHDSGVNGGTTFLTYSHMVVNSQSLIKDSKDFQVVACDDVIYSPLTKEHAKYICTLLNLQSKHLYEKHLTEIQQKQNIK